MMSASPDRRRFVFPVDRFPTFDPFVDAVPEEFGPPLSFRTDDVSNENFPWCMSGFAFVPSDSEKEKNLLDVSYSTAENNYFRPHHIENERFVNGWETCVWRYRNMFRKDEYDWNMTYLAREETAPGLLGGVIEWRFDLKSAGSLSFSIQHYHFS